MTGGARWPEARQKPGARASFKQAFCSNRVKDRRMPSPQNAIGNPIEAGKVSHLDASLGSTPMRPELTNWPPGTHNGTEQEQVVCRKTLALRFPHTIPFRQGLSHKESGRFWAFSPTVDECRKSN
jgi:hypothetical protein